MPATPKDVRGGSRREGVAFILRRPATGGAAVPRPKYQTEEERREAARQTQRKYVEANREAINAQQVERARKRRAAMKAGQKES
jgi:hypothetical protein